MESLSILVIAITGFLYVNLSLITRYKFKRSTDWSAYLYVVGWGIIFFFVAWLITLLLSSFGCLRLIYDWLSSRINLSGAVMATSNLEERKNLLKFIFVCVLSISLASLMGYANRAYYNSKRSKDKKLIALSKMISNNPLESLVLESQIRSFPVLVTLSSSKVYVGLVRGKLFIEDGRLEYISLFPLLSGYRDTSNLEVKFTTNYYNHYQNFLSDSNANDSNNNPLNIGDFKITFPISEISSISFFNMDTYNKFQENKVK